MAMVQVGMGLSRAVLLVGAGFTGSVALRNGGRLSDFLSEIQEILREKGIGGDGNGAENVSDALTIQLAREVRQLLSNNVTVRHVDSGKSAVSALIAPAAAARAVGYGLCLHVVEKYVIGWCDLSRPIHRTKRWKAAESPGRLATNGQPLWGTKRIAG